LFGRLLALDLIAYLLERDRTDFLIRISQEPNDSINQFIAGLRMNEWTSSNAEQ
jgi:hypothetical protein